MNRKPLLIISLVIPFTLSLTPPQTSSGPYLGQPPPGTEPVLFAPDVITERVLGLTFTPDGNELFFTLWGRDPRATVMVTRLEDGAWSESAVAPFSGTWQDWDCNLSPGGNRLYFSSMRPGTEGGEAGNEDIWYVEREPDGEWGNPINVGAPVNTPEVEVHPTVSSKGTLFFFSNRESGTGGNDIYYSPFIDGAHQEPQLLGAAINTEHQEMDPFVAPDESYLIFHSDRPGGIGANDLWISFRNDDGSWNAAVNMGPVVNTPGHDLCGRVSFDGKYLFFKCRRDEVRGTYWIDARFLKELRK